MDTPSDSSGADGTTGSFVTPAGEPVESTDFTTGPAAVVKKFYARLVSGNQSDACALLLPDQKSGCDGPTIKVTGSVTVKRVVIWGGYALVSIVGQICATNPDDSTQKQCRSNSNPDAGMPSSHLDFEPTFEAAESTVNSSFGPVPARLVDGAWLLG